MFYGRNLKTKLIATCVLGFLSAAQGAEDEHRDKPDPALPDLQFLEFLGQFETDSGQWLDPDSLLTEEFGNLLDAAIAATLDPDSDDDSGAGDDSDSMSTAQPSNN